VCAGLYRSPHVISRIRPPYIAFLMLRKLRFGRWVASNAAVAINLTASQGLNARRTIEGMLGEAFEPGYSPDSWTHD